MVRIPKKVAGVKVPKRLRKRGKKLLAQAQSPQGREAIAAGLTIAGAAIAAAARSRTARAEPAAASPPPPPRTGEPGIAPGAPLNEAITAGIGALQTFLAGRRAR